MVTVVHFKFMTTYLKWTPSYVRQSKLPQTCEPKQHTFIIS